MMIGWKNEVPGAGDQICSVYGMNYSRFGFATKQNLAVEKSFQSGDN